MDGSTSSLLHDMCGNDVIGYSTGLVVVTRINFRAIRTAIPAITQIPTVIKYSDETLLLAAFFNPFVHIEHEDLLFPTVVSRRRG